MFIPRVQKQRANKSEDAVGQLQVHLDEREQRINDFNADMETLRSRVDKVAKEKAQSMAENSALKM